MSEEKNTYWPAVIMAMLQQAQRKAQKRIEDDKYGTVRGHVVGSDNGFDRDKKLPRNKPCLCGSGEKAKKCCKIMSVALNKRKENNEPG